MQQEVSKFTRSELEDFNYQTVYDDEGREYGVNRVGDIIDGEAEYAGRMTPEGPKFSKGPAPIHFKFLIDEELPAPEGMFKASKKFVFKTGVKTSQRPEILVPGMYYEDEELPKRVPKEKTFMQKVLELQRMNSPDLRDFMAGRYDPFVSGHRKAVLPSTANLPVPESPRGGLVTLRPALPPGEQEEETKLSQEEEEEYERARRNEELYGTPEGLPPVPANWRERVYRKKI